MKLEITTKPKYIIINVLEYDKGDFEELSLILASFSCFYPWYVSPHSDGISKIIYNFDGYLTRVNGIELFNSDFYL